MIKDLTQRRREQSVIKGKGEDRRYARKTRLMFSKPKSYICANN